MNEEFLAYIWKHQYFDKAELQTACGQELAILRTGFQNSNAGPDFQQATLRIGEITWAGSVELHVKASDWQKHGHATDRKYDQVVLHVVWENDLPVQRTNGTEIPVLALKERVSPELLQAYGQIKQPKATIPCEPFLQQVPDITRIMMVERTLLERLENKAAGLQQIFSRQQQDWEVTAFRALLRAFGFKINQVGFEKLAEQLPWQVLRKHRHQRLQTEALIFGQAGYLEGEAPDEYIGRLQKEFRFLQHKYRLPEPLQLSDWNFLRLRPANFPTVRLAQLAALVGKHDHWFAGFMQLQDLNRAYEFFMAMPSVYWQTHYLPGKSGKLKTGSLGKGSIRLLLINAVAPLQAAYALERGQPEITERALNLLEQLPPEQNHLLEMYEQLGFANKTAGQSQGLLSLYHNYCAPVRCLHCAIGNSILKRAKTS